MRDRRESLILTGAVGSNFEVRFLNKEVSAMLVLTRECNEEVVLLLPPELATGPGIQIEVKVLNIRGDKVRLGFCAPECVGILRAEVLARIREGIGRGDTETRGGETSVSPLSPLPISPPLSSLSTIGGA
jgi:carbon storage regulator CsrA